MCVHRDVAVNDVELKTLRVRAEEKCVERYGRWRSGANVPSAQQRKRRRLTWLLRYASPASVSLCCLNTHTHRSRYTT